MHDVVCTSGYGCSAIRAGCFIFGVCVTVHDWCLRLCVHTYLLVLESVITLVHAFVLLLAPLGWLSRDEKRNNEDSSMHAVSENVGGVVILEKWMVPVEDMVPLFLWKTWCPCEKGTRDSKNVWQKKGVKKEFKYGKKRSLNIYYTD